MYYFENISFTITTFQKLLLQKIMKNHLIFYPSLAKLVLAFGHPGGVFLDFPKHSTLYTLTLLPTKTEQYGIRGVPLKFFASCLSNGQQYVQLENTVSSTQTTRCSSLGPILFLICINDLPDCSNILLFRIFADDTNVFTTASYLKTVEQLMNTKLKI